MKILFLSRWFPYPPDNGSKLRIFNILKQLSRGHEVALFTFGSAADVANNSALLALREYCSHVRILPYRDFRPTSLRALLGLFSRRPRYLVDTHSQHMVSAVADEVRRRRRDVVVASELAMAPYALHLPGVAALLEDLELSVFRDAVRQPSMLPHRVRPALTWLKLCAYLRSVLPRFAACTVVSEQERANLRAVCPAYTSVEVIPNAVDLSGLGGSFGPPCPNTLVFTGALTYSANYDAVSYLLREVWPLIARAVPDVTLRVTGSTEGVDLASLPQHPGVHFTGYVGDVRPVVAQSWASIVPLRLGAGTRVKVLESMALGTPVVSTTKGAEGLEVRDGENILIADSPTEFAKRVVDLLRSPELRARLATAGRRLVESKHNWEVVGQELRALVERVGTCQLIRRGAS